MRGETRYSKMIPGDPGNYRNRARFDLTDDYLGITEWRKSDARMVERVLLSPAQVTALLQFLRPRPRTRRKGVAA